MAAQTPRTMMILDGGMSRELIRLKAPFRQPEWSAQALFEGPEFVKQVHQNFVAAGADILTTNSYAVVPFHIGEERFFRQGRDLADLAGRLAREVAEEEHQRTRRKVFVAGSLPPMFGSYRPDLFNEDQVQEYLSVLVEGLSSHIDFWLGETLSVIAEAEAVLKAVRSTGKKCWISFTVDDQTRSAEESVSQPRLRSGELVTDAVRWAMSKSAEISALLFNCSQPEFMSAAVREASKILAETGTEMLLGVYANAFEPKPDDYQANKDVAPTRRDLDPRLYSDLARSWVENGASIVGGCCGIGHEHIAALSQNLR